MTVNKLDAVMEFISANHLDIQTHRYTKSAWCYSSNREHLGMVKAIAAVVGLSINYETSHTDTNEWVMSLKE